MQHLGMQNGHNVKETVQCMMASFMTNKLMSDFNFKGVKRRDRVEKIGLIREAKELVACIRGSCYFVVYLYALFAYVCFLSLAAVKLKFPAAMERKEIDMHIKDYLKYAPGRVRNNQE